MAAYQQLKLDVGLQSLPLARRQEVTAFLRRFGRLLHDTIFPPGRAGAWDTRAPLLLELSREWVAYPWELLNQGEEWLALRQGVVRYVAPPDLAPPAAPAPEALRVLALTAQPLPKAEESALTAHERQLGTRFITVAGAALDTDTGAPPGYECRAVEHASRADLEEGLQRFPHVLLFSGFAGPDGWYLEAARGLPNKVGQDWLHGRTRLAVGEGLRLMVLNDSLGLADPSQAALLTRTLLDAGLEGIVRFEGRQARLREQDYLRTLVRALAQGAPLAAAHLGSIRRLHRRFADGWDWSFPRLYLRGLPIAGAVPAAPLDQAARSSAAETSAAESAAAEAPAPGLWPGGLADVTGGFASLPAPPVFAGRRRAFNRYTDLGKLLDVLQPKGGPALTFLSGPPGSGKTHLALELARRLSRTYAQTAYLQSRDLLPDPFELLPLTTLARPAGGSLQQLFGTLAVHLGAKPALSGPAERWDTAVEAHVADGQPRLVILDRLEHVPGFDAFCSALPHLPGATRFLLLTRAKPPLVPGKLFELAPLEPAGQERLWDEEFLEQLRQPVHGAELGTALAAACAQDLLSARLLRRLPRWPLAAELRAALLPGPASHAAPAPNALLTLLARRVVPFLSPDAVEALRHLVLQTSLVHRELLAAVSQLDARRLQAALTELQWLGLVDAYDGERYFAVPARLQTALGEQVLNAEFFAAAVPRLVQAYQTYLAQAQQWLESAGGAAHAVPGLAWCAAAGIAPSALRQQQRLAVERTNLSELVALLVEERDWPALRRLCDALQPLQGFPAWRDLMALAGHCLLGAGEALKEPELQAQALLRLADPLVSAGHFAAATPLLEKSLDLLRTCTAWELLGDVYLQLSACYVQQRREEPATNLLLAAVELAQQLGRPRHLLRALTGLLALWEKLEDGLAQAQQFLPSRIEYLERHGHALDALRARRLLADACLQAGKTNEAAQQYRGLAERFRGQGAHSDLYQTRLRLAECQARLRQPEQALAGLEGAHEEWSGPPDVEQENRILLAVALALEESDRPQQALEVSQRVRRNLESAGDRAALIRVLDGIGRLYFRLGEQAQSTRCYEERLQLQASLPRGEVLRPLRG